MLFNNLDGVHGSSISMKSKEIISSLGKLVLSPFISRPCDYTFIFVRFLYSRGGFQEARGGAKGAEYYVENLFEELDSRGEYFFDSDTHHLYFYTNTTHSDRYSMRLVASNLKTLLRIEVIYDRFIFMQICNNTNHIMIEILLTEFIKH